MKKAFIISSAECYPSASDLNLLNTYLNKNGWTISKRIGLANAVIVYTCACSKSVEDKSIKIITQAQKKKNRSAQLIVAGCLPSINRTRLKHVFKGMTVSANYLQEFDKLLNQEFSINGIEYTGPDRKLKKNEYAEYHLRIEWGCYGKCSYCAVKFVFGKPRSRPVLDILKEFDIAYRKGYRRFVLVANDAGSYGRDLRISLAHLINRLCQKHKGSRFLLSHITPDKLKDILPSLERLICSGKILRMNIPVQSGSNRIIRLMNRLYTVNNFKYCIKKLINYNPNLEIKTDIMVGFPSETEQDFLDTLKLVEWLGRNKVRFQCFTYSKRPNTEASKLPGQIDQRTKIYRFRRLANLCNFSYIVGNKKLFHKLKSSKPNFALTNVN